MTQHRFAEGDVVCLKSGGAEMVIVAPIYPFAGLKRQVAVAWFNKRGEAKRGAFPAAALRFIR